MERITVQGLVLGVATFDYVACLVVLLADMADFSTFCFLEALTAFFSALECLLAKVHVHVGNSRPSKAGTAFSKANLISTKELASH